MRRFAPIIVALVLLIVFAACAQPAPTVTPVPPPTAVPTAVPPTPTSLPAPTAGELAALGQKVFDRSCSSCHGAGYAPAPSHWIQRFATAQELYDYARTRMPTSQPGSLPPEEYFQIVAWEWVGYKILPADAVLDVNKLAEIALSK
jgi:cytochrome c5